MKTIGIKLADGSFYPVLKEDSSEEVVLNLTTANNNQTKVMVDLYRSETGSMDDAEYVDSLQIDDLNAHPNGEPNISFTVSLDENNELHAQIVDSETGAESNSEIQLISRPEEELSIPDDYTVEQTEDNTEAQAVAALATGVGLLAAAESMKEDSETDIEAEIEAEESKDDLSSNVETSFTEDDLSAFGGEATANQTDTNDDLNDFFGNISDEPEVEEEIEIPDYREEEPEAEESVEETPAEPYIPNDMDEPPADEPVGDEEPVFEETPSFDMDEPPVSEPDPSEEINFDMDEPVGGEEPVASEEPSFDMDEPVASEEPVFEEDPISTDLPDFNIQEEVELPDMDFNLPEETFEAPSASEADDFFHINSDDTQTESELNFSGLYDEQPDFESEEEETKKKTKKPVIICIICAIICLIAAALVLFVLPTEFNLLKNGKLKSKTEKSEETPVEIPEAVTETPKVEKIPEAKEDEIIIIEKAEEVVPLPPPVTEEKPQDIIYKIKWGDTLWDISDTYYKNPWRYKYIARFNGIQNPDYIVSGTYITIPAE